MFCVSIGMVFVVDCMLGGCCDWVEVEVLEFVDFLVEGVFSLKVVIIWVVLYYVSVVLLG